MQHQDFLLTLAEVSIAFVAFVTIIFVLRQFGEKRLSALQILVARALIELGLTAFIFSILPILISNFGISGPPLWSTVSGLLAVAMILSWGLWPYRRRRVAGEKGPPPGFTYYMTISTSIIAAGLAGLNAVLWGDYAIYAVVLTWELAAGAFVFLWSLSVFIVPEESS